MCATYCTHKTGPSGGRKGEKIFELAGDRVFVEPALRLFVRKKIPKNAESYGIDEF